MQILQDADVNALDGTALVLLLRTHMQSSLINNHGTVAAERYKLLVWFMQRGPRV